MDCTNNMLHTDDEARSGVLVGPPERRYRLDERLLPPHDPLKREMCYKRPTVWLGTRLRDGANVVLKVNSQGSDGFGFEMLRLQRISGIPTAEEPERRQSSHPGRAHCVRLLDSFHLPSREQEYASYEAPHMLEPCVVLEVLGPSLHDWRAARPAETFLLPLVRRLVRQILLALDFLHTEIGCSYGALTLDNILLTAPFTDEELRADAPLQDPTIKLISFEWGRERIEQYPDPWMDDHYHTLSSGAIETPEHWFMNYDENAGPADAHDSWAVGVITSLLLFNKDLAHLVPVEAQENYERRRSSRFCVEAGIPPWHVTGEGIVDLASLDPEAGWPAWFATSDSGDPDITGYTDFTCEADSLASFLRACWTLNPFEQPRMKELLAHEWLRGVE
ncbi:hypothetical protein JCM10450v2_003575 [Rhodotorula kratochvilovae]